MGFGFISKELILIYYKIVEILIIYCINFIKILFIL